MEFVNPFAASRGEIVTINTKFLTADAASRDATKPPRSPRSKYNHSVPSLSRHESSESSSSDGSVPSMTDTSDSDISFDDDSVYNTSAGELWDSFWPDNTEKPGSRQPQVQHVALLQAIKRSDNFSEYSENEQHAFGSHECAVKGLNIARKPKIEELVPPCHTFQTPTSQYSPRKNPATYSVYPKIPVTSLPRHPHPPRTSSLSFEPPPTPPPQRPLFLRGSKSSAALRTSKPNPRVQPLFIAPALPSGSTAASQHLLPPKTAVSLPVSPAYPPLPISKTLRSSSSAFSLRDKARAQSHSNKLNLNKLLPSPLLQPSPSTATTPQVERFVSVFELDSDSDDDDSFAKRIARGLHKKSGSEKRAAAERKTVTVGLASASAALSSTADGSSSSSSSSKDLQERLKDSSNSLSRKRGGSLGRIFGLMSR
ncbi:hypothetical protein F4808DRAFT_415351 [Astrocystis sublimbata]|nr:hypothetical protein F4808DRAFT_415351 [Astrocystis sublimbata]